MSLRGFAQSSAAQSKTPVVAPPTATKQWTGDLDVLLKHQIIRVGVPYSKTLYYTVKGTQYGVAYEGGKAFEEYLNKKYRRQQQKNVRIYVIFIVTPRDEAVVNLDNGNLDILIGNLIITPERQKLVDFSNPTVNGVNEIVVSGPNSPQLASVDDLSGKEVFARKTSSYWEHLEQLNARFQKQKKTAVKLRAVPEDLSDEDLLQMVNAGLLQTIVVNDWTAKLWSQLLTKLQVHSDISVASGQALGWAVRKDSPKLLAVINEFLKTHRQGTAFGNRVLTEYTGSYSPPLFIVPKLTRRFVHHHRTAFHSLLRVICVQQERHPHLNSRSLLKTAPSSFTPNSSIPLTIHSLRIQTPTLHRRPLASSVARL